MCVGVWMSVLEGVCGLELWCSRTPKAGCETPPLVLLLLQLLLPMCVHHEVFWGGGVCNVCVCLQGNEAIAALKAKAEALAVSHPMPGFDAKTMKYNTL